MTNMLSGLSREEWEQTKKEARRRLVEIEDEEEQAESNKSA